MHYYLAQWEGTGTKADPFRPVGAGPGVGAVDLRPDSTRVDGYALLSMEVRNDQPKNYYCGNDLDGISPAAKNRIENALGITLVSNSFRDIFFELVDPLAGHAKPNDPAWWKPLTLTAAKAWELYIHGELVKKVQNVGGGVTDAFTRANESPIASPWSWTGNTHQIALTSNTVQKGAGADLEFIYYPGAASSADQYSQWLLVTTGDGTNCPAVRVSTDRNGYAMVLDNLFKVVGGSISTPWSMSYSPTATHTYRLEISGSTLTAKDNGATVTGTPNTDTTITTGQPGLFWYSPGGSFDSFDGGDLAAAAPVLAQSHYRWRNDDGTLVGPAY